MLSHVYDTLTFVEGDRVMIRVSEHHWETAVVTDLGSFVNRDVEYVQLLRVQHPNGRHKQIIKTQYLNMISRRQIRNSSAE